MKIWVIVAVALLNLMEGTEAVGSDITWDEIGRENQDIYSVLVHPQEPDTLYAGTQNEVIKTTDGGEAWYRVLSVRGMSGIVNDLSFDPKNSEVVYAATANGLFRSNNQGKSWNKIYKGKDYLASDCTSVGVLACRLLVGTKAGLFVSLDDGRSWHKEEGELGGSPIFTIVSDEKTADSMYVSCSRGIYRSRESSKSWEKILVNMDPSLENQNAEEPHESEDSVTYSYLSVTPGLSKTIYYAVHNRIIGSKDGGRSWDSIPSLGLLGSDIACIRATNESDLYVATDSGIFFYSNGEWHDVSAGLTAPKIRNLTVDNRGTMYAATNNGLFRTIKISHNNRQDAYISLYYMGEPDIKEVQSAAIRYAEVEPEKIYQWRKKAARSAWLPKVGVSVDSDAADLWHWESGSTTREGDDVLVRGKTAVEWGVSLSWDLSSLIWNDDQTSIDVRSRLMVQLRDDILDKATKLYFERIRLKRELELLSPAHTSKLFEKELKLQELTASLDALTGGFFSEKRR